MATCLEHLSPPLRKLHLGEVREVVVPLFEIKVAKGRLLCGILRRVQSLTQLKRNTSTFSRGFAHLKYLTRSPSSALLLFWVEGSPTKIDKVGQHGVAFF